MGINRTKIISAQVSVLEKINDAFINLQNQSITKKDCTDLLKQCEKLTKEVEANHKKLMADGIGDEEYFSNNIFEEIVEKIEELSTKLKRNLFEKPSSLPDPGINSTGADKSDKNKPGFNDQRGDSKFKKKLEILNRKMDDLRICKEADEYQIKLIEILFEETKSIYDKLSDYDNELEDLYNEMLQEYFEEIPKLKKKVKNEEEPTSSVNLELEKLKIPVFYGDIKEWATFHNLFKDMVHNNNKIPKAEKMLRLRLTLKGEAARLIQHLQISAEGYEAAWSLLKQRYNNKRILFTTQWDRLLDQPTIKNDNVESVRELLDTTNECLNAIKSLNIDLESADPLIARIIVRKLDKDGLILYEQTIKKSKEIQTLNDIMEFLDQQYQTLKAVAEKEPLYKKRKKQVYKVHVAATNSEVNKNKKFCFYCKYPNHLTMDCRKFIAIPIENRRTFAKTEKLCYKCLDHKWGENCKNFKLKCKICKKSHHDLLHIEETAEKTTSMTTSQPKTTVILATALIKARSSNGEYIFIRALIDQGSQITSISEEAVQMLGVPRIKNKAKIHGLGEAVVGESKHKVMISIKPRFSSNWSEKVEAFVLPSLTSAQPDQTFKYDLQKWKNYLLADPMFNISDRIDMILGGDIFGKILETGVRKTNGIVGQATKFGWILSGIINQQKPKQLTSAITNLERFWEIEEEETTINEDQICLKKYKETTTQDVDGRFIVEIPFKDDKDLGTSRKQAVARLTSLHKKFLRDEKLQQAYKIFIEEYIKLGHMTKVAEIQMLNIIYHIMR